VQQERHLGLSESEHRRASGLMTRVYSGLRGVMQMIHRRYPRTHQIHKELEESVASVQAARLEMENAARAEHPAGHIVYLSNDIGISPDVLEHACATSGDDIETN